jgi:hypothetical protein
MKISLEILEDQQKWDELVEKAPHRTLFHTWEYLRIMEQHTSLTFFNKKIRGKLLTLAGYEGTTPVCVFPIFLYDCGLVRLLMSPPSRVEDPCLGPLFISYDEQKQSRRESLAVNLQKSLDEYMSKKIKASNISIHTSPGYSDSRPFMWGGYHVRPKYTYTIRLSKNPETVWNRFEGQLRKDIKKTEREGATVVEGSREDIGFIYDSLVKRRRQEGRSYRGSKEHILSVYDRFSPENVKIFIAKYLDKPVTGLILIRYKNKALYWVGGAKAETKGVYANDLAIWHSIRWACEEGLDEYELVGANDEKLRQFKSKYNPDLTCYFSAEKTYSKGYRLIKGFQRLI